MKKTYILYCYIISVILMPFKWFEPEHMTDLSEWGFKCISQSGRDYVACDWRSADSGKAYRGKRTDSGGNRISGNRSW